MKKTLKIFYVIAGIFFVIFGLQICLFAIFWPELLTYPWRHPLIGLLIGIFLIVVGVTGCFCDPKFIFRTDVLGLGELFGFLARPKRRISEFDLNDKNKKNAKDTEESSGRTE